MVLYQPSSSPRVVDVKICSLSFHRHNNNPTHGNLNHKNHNHNNNNTTNNNSSKYQTNLLRGSRRYNYPPGVKMADSQNQNRQQQQQLPVVELKPFSRKVWRREKSLPDFYERNRANANTAEESSSSQSSNAQITQTKQQQQPSLEISPMTSRLVRELTDVRKSLETRQNNNNNGDSSNHTSSSCVKFRSHPKAEFCHESTKTWRKQDLIPGFITRFERTKTSMETLQRENSSLNQQQHNSLPFSSDDLWDGNGNHDSLSGPQKQSAMRVRGGKMNQHIYRRHLLYLNPLEHYRHPNSWGGPHYNSTDNSRHSTGREHLAPSRNSFPLSSGRAREIMLSGSQFNHPLKPIQRDETSSPHKFNSKLGAAKCSLQILNKLGSPTKLERALEMEYELNLERFRKDRFFLPHELRLLSNSNSGYVQFDSTPTIGEALLRTAREANKPKKRYQAGDERGFGLAKQDSVGLYRSDAPVPDIQRTDTNSFVNPLNHPIDTVLHEEYENQTYTEDDSNDSLVQSSDKPESTNISEIPSHTTYNNRNRKSNSDRLGPNPEINIDPPVPSDFDSRLTKSDPGNNYVSDGNSIPKLTQNQQGEESNTENQSQIIGNNDLKSKCEDLHIDTSSKANSDINLDNNNDGNNNDNNDNNSVDNNINNNNNGDSQWDESDISPVDSSRIETNIEYLNNLQRKSVSAHSSLRPTTRSRDQNSTLYSHSASEMSTTYVNHEEKSSNNDVIKQNGRNYNKENGGRDDKTTSEDSNYHTEGDNHNKSKSESNTSDNADANGSLTPSVAGNMAPSNTNNEGDLTLPLDQRTNANDDTNLIAHNLFIPVKIGGPVIDNDASASTTNKSRIGEVHPSVPSKTEDSTLSSESKNVRQTSNSIARGHVNSKVANGNTTLLTDESNRQENGQKKSTNSSEGIKAVSKEDNSGATDQSGKETGVKTGPNGQKYQTEITENSTLKLNSINTDDQKESQNDNLLNSAKMNDSGSPEDEGISMMTPTERAALESSMKMTEACSDQDGGGSGSAINGDSGISTTFITADDSRPKELEGLMV